MHPVAIQEADSMKIGSKITGTGKVPKNKTLRGALAEQLTNKSADLAKSDPVGVKGKNTAGAKKKAGTCMVSGML